MLHVILPSPWFVPYHYFTQEAFFSECVADVISLSTTMFQGMTLPQLHGAIKCWIRTARGVHAGSTTVVSFREEAHEALKRGGQVGVNFARPGLGMLGGGHWSPLGAYNQEEDRFLLLDVSKYKYPPVWASTDDIFSAMDTIDSTSGMTRGYIIIIEE